MLYMGEMLVPSHRPGTVSYCSWYKYFTGSNRTPGIHAPPSKPGSRNEKHLSLTGCRTGQARYGGTDRGCGHSRFSHVFGRECPVPFISTDRRPPVYRLTLADPAGNSGCNHPTGPYDPPLPRKGGIRGGEGPDPGAAPSRCEKPALRMDTERHQTPASSHHQWG